MPSNGSDRLHPVDTAPATARIGYLVHDLGDAAVARRILMFRAAGAEVVLAGFSRDRPPATVVGVPAQCLGRTHDGRLTDRMKAVAKALVAARAAMRGADVLVARNLEMLILAVAAKRGRRIVYECLDIHRTLTGTSLAARLVQRVERTLLRRVDLVLTSSPRFVTEHFARPEMPPVPASVYENKVLALGPDRPQPAAHPVRAPGTPWRIGWFGMLRCRRSLALLSGLAARSAGRIEVVIAGRPSPAEFDDFDAQVAAAPGVQFVGAYQAGDLPVLYGTVDFAWAIDYFEEGENSTWLLPNRLYEASAHGVVPIALAGVETGAWLRRRDVGLVVDDPETTLPAKLAAMTDDAFADLRAGILALPQSDLIADRTDCDRLVQAVTDTAVPHLHAAH